MHAWSLSEGEVYVVRVGLCCAGLSWRCGKEGELGSFGGWANFGRVGGKLC